MAMSLTVRLDDDDYARLAKTASALGMLPGALARMMIRTGLRTGAAGVAAAPSDRQAALDALRTLAELAADLPPVDAVAVAVAARSELDNRWP